MTFDLVFKVVREVFQDIGFGGVSEENLDREVRWREKCAMSEIETGKISSRVGFVFRIQMHQFNLPAPGMLTVRKMNSSGVVL